MRAGRGGVAVCSVPILPLYTHTQSTHRAHRAHRAHTSPLCEHTGYKVLGFGFGGRRAWSNMTARLALSASREEETPACCRWGGVRRHCYTCGSGCSSPKADAEEADPDGADEAQDEAATERDAAVGQGGHQGKV